MSSEQNPGPENRLGYLIKHAQLRHRELNDAALAPYGIDGRELGVLLAVAEGEPRSQQEVAARLSIDRTTMVAMLDTLETKGVVIRSPDPDDRRRNVVAVTEAGAKLLVKAMRASDGVERAFLEPLDAQTAAAFRRALNVLTAPADPAR